MEIDIQSEVLLKRANPMKRLHVLVLSTISMFILSCSFSPRSLLQRNKSPEPKLVVEQTIPQPQPEKKPKRVSIPKNFEPNEIGLNTAIQLLGLPRKLGFNPENNKSEAGISIFQKDKQ